MLFVFDKDFVRSVIYSIQGVDHKQISAHEECAKGEWRCDVPVEGEMEETIGEEADVCAHHC